MSYPQAMLGVDIASGVIHANTGGPRSRSRSERITSSLLGDDDGVIQCPGVIRLGLRFEDTHPVDCLESILLTAGFRSPEELRNKFNLPQTRLICGPLPKRIRRLNAHNGDPAKVLMQALMLGLCTCHVFDPDRPVLWTETSLTRSLELFDPGGYYA